MENELKKLAAAMRDMSDMVGDHHWQAAKAIEELGALKIKKAEPIILGDLDPQQLDVERGEKLGADGLEVVAWWLKNTEGKNDLVGLGSGVHVYQGVYDEKILLCRLNDAQRLLSQLREELAQRDARIAELERLRGDGTTSDKYRAELYDEVFEKARRMGFGNVTMALAAIESQQAASVGGERDEQAAFERWLDRVSPSGDVEQVQAQWEASADYADFIAALSPAGGGVVTREQAEQFLVAYHAEVWAAAEDEDARVAYDEAGRQLAKGFLNRFGGAQ